MINIKLSLPLNPANKEELEKTVAELKAFWCDSSYFGTAGAIEALVDEIEKLYNPDLQ